MAIEGRKKIIFGASAGIAGIVASVLGGVFEREGGFVDHKLDRGGATAFGVTQGVARQNGYKGNMRDFSKVCYTEADVCAEKIYYTDYIVKPGFVPVLAASEAVGEELVDTGVNMGPARPSRWLQESLNEVCTPIGFTVKIATDGKIGNSTISAFTTCQAKMGKVRFCKTMLDSLDGKQKDMYDRIVRNNPSQRVFYKGWINHRIGNVKRSKCDKEA
jgi:lysozyme family protein